MDSNSGSLQSSSGDEEYDSRAADSSPFSAFMNNPSSTHLGAMPNPLRPPSHHHNNNQITSSMFDPSSLSGYNFDPLSSRSLPNQNPLLNLDMLIWSKTLRSDPNCTDPPNILPSSSPSPPIQTRFRTSSSSSPVVPVPPMPENVAVTVRPSSLASSEQTSTCSGSGTAGVVGVRNSKKRSRASRRAPTTVLTTDTTNFRAMVQEFTGIPAPPFSTSSSSPFPRTRFDLFSSSTIHPPSSSSSQPPPPPYLLRPFAQKIQPPQPQPLPLPFVSSSSPNNNTSTTTAISTNMTTTNSTSINYQLPVVNSDLIHQVNTMHNNNNNPMLSFQSLLQTTPKYQLPNSINNTLGSSRPPNDEFGLGNHGHVNPHLTASRRGDISGNNTANWGGGDRVMGSNNNEVGDHHGFLLRSVNGNNYGNPQQQQPQRDTNGKGNNYMAASPSSNFNGDRGGGGGGSENVSTRSEGMVESWLCSSD